MLHNAYTETVERAMEVDGKTLLDVAAVASGVLVAAAAVVKFLFGAGREVHKLEDQATKFEAPLKDGLNEIRQLLQSTSTQTREDMLNMRSDIKSLQQDIVNFREQAKEKLNEHSRQIADLQLQIARVVTRQAETRTTVNMLCDQQGVDRPFNMHDSAEDLPRSK